jgi:hypothetical protein
MQVIRSYNQDAFSPSSEFDAYRPYPVVVYYDPVGLQLNAIEGTGLTFMFEGIALRGQAGHVPANICFDSGANSVFVSQAFVERSGFSTKPCNSKQLTVANGQTSAITGMCELHLKIQSYQGKVQGFVTPLAGPYDIILGESWLKQQQAALDYGDKTITIRKGGGKVSISCQPAQTFPSKSSRSSPKLLSVAQVKRAVQKGEHVFYCLISEVVDKQESANEMSCMPSIRELISEYSDVILTGDTLPPGLPPERPHLPPTIPLLPDAVPVARPMYRLSQLERREVERLIREGLLSGMIECSSSNWSSPTLFVRKKTGELRMCLDLRALNKVTKRNATSTPDVQTLLDQIGRNEVWSTLDCMQAYHQIRLRDEEKPLTAFRSHLGLYQYTVMNFGLVNAPSTWLRCINDALGDAVGRTCLVYMDDIIVMSPTPESHPAAVRDVLDRLRKAQIYLKARKCNWASEHVEFLGYNLGPNGIECSPKKIRAIQEWPVPKNVGEVRSFVGLATWFRRFLRGFSNQISPLTALTRKDVPFLWSPEAQNAFESVKAALTSAPVLALPLLGADAPPFTVISDASGFGLGACLLQEGHPVAFESRKMTPAERNYGTGEQELLAVVHAFKVWRPYLEGGGKVTVITDHLPNTYLPTQQLMSRRKTRWQEFLSRFEIELIYKPGRTNMADPLSRIPSLLLLVTVLARDAEGYVDAELDAQQTVLVKDLQAAYESDTWFAEEKNIKELRYKGGLYFYQGNRVAVADDATLKMRLIRESHDPPHAGHFGVLKTYKTLERDFWWPGMRKTVDDYVSSCSSCQRNKSRTQREAGPVQPLGVPEYNWQDMTMDFITQLPPTKRGHDAIVVFVDRMSKMVHFAPCKSSVTAVQTARLYYDNVFKLHGLVAKVITDRGPQFTSQVWRELMSMLGTEVALSTSFHPCTDGQTERANRTLEQYLRHYVAASHDDWDDWLASAEYAVNSQYNESTKCSAFKLIYGQDPRSPLAVPQEFKVPVMLNSSGSKTPLTVPRDFKVPAVQQWHGRMSETLKAAKTALQAAQNKYAAYSKTKKLDVSYAVDEYVLLSSKNIRLKGPRDGSRKFHPRFIGPFKIIKKVGAVAYKLELPENMKRVHPVFHVSLLKKWVVPFRSQPPPPTLEIEGEPLWLFERILDHRKKGRKHEYLVKWKDYGHEHNSWEPESSFDHCRVEITKYWDSVKNAVPSMESNDPITRVDQTMLEQQARTRKRSSGAANRATRASQTRPVA